MSSKHATACSLDQYALTYWPGFQGRAGPAILLLEDAQAHYTLNSDCKSMSSAFGGTAPGHPVFAPPILTDGEGLCLSQTAAIMEHLGKIHGYAPQSHTRFQKQIELRYTSPQKLTQIREQERAVARNAGEAELAEHGRVQLEINSALQHDARANAYCMQLCLDACDIMSEAYGKKGPHSPETRQEAINWLQGRFQGWLSHLEQTCDCFHGPYFFGDHPTYADFTLLSAFQWVEFLFSTIDFSSAPKLEEWFGTIQARPNIAAYMASDRCTPILYPGISLVAEEQN